MKKLYIQPVVNSESIRLESMILAGSPAPAPSGDMIINSGTSTEDQW